MRTWLSETLYTLDRLWIDVKGADYWVMWQGFKKLYLLAEPAFWPYVFGPDQHYGWTNKWMRALCRLAGHPRGPIWFNPGGDEPNYHCWTCGDDTG